MKRLHVSVSVGNLDESIRFYSALFDAAPTVRKPDYSRWMLDDPRVNFAISTHGHGSGVDHLGIQVEDERELREIYVRMDAAERPVREVGETTCCYARSEKSWITDPQGISWEAFLTTRDSETYGEDTGQVCCDNPSADSGIASAAPAACCASPSR